MRAPKYPGIHATHRRIRFSSDDYRCSCGVPLGRSYASAIGAMHRHRDSVTFDEWLADYVDVGDCWIWTSRIDRNGYGRVGDQRLAHRYVYERLVGPIDSGLTLDHLCRVPLCVNPDHLEPVTRGINTLRGFCNSARNARKTSCARGHPFDSANTYYEKRTGKRHCRECQRNNAPPWAARKARRLARLGESEDPR